FWPAEGSMRAFSRVMSSPPMKWAILRRNFFVERIIPAGTAAELSEAEMDHYRGVQPTPEARAGVAEFPRQIVAAGPWLAELERAVERELSRKRVLITWPMRDIAFRAPKLLPRMRSAFRDVEVVGLRKARHYFQEDAPEDVVAAVRGRFG
ncbi:MAG TPA: hypothetical protein VGR10_05765, partial [Thermoleophilaceae bacterium]|nr:hypothetical protein [Thermoleophilaceae bacterium]